MNYFDIFGFKVQFELDTQRLAERYRELQRSLHPDKYATASEQEKRIVVQKSAEINDAQQTLKDPVSRAEYLLKLRGLDIQHETQTLQDPMFLMQQMEYRERLEDIRNADDPFSETVSFEQDVKQQTSSYLTELAQQLNGKQNQAAADTIRKLKFMVKLEQELERLEDDLVEL